MKNTKNITLALAATLLLTGCAGMFGQYDIDALNKASPKGNKFNSVLTSEYRELANSEWKQMDWKDGQYFAKKGLASAGTEAPLPDEVSSRRIPAFAVADLTEAHDRLIAKLNRGARKNKPVIAAKAQASYDCWLEQQEENHQPADIAACRKLFEQNIAKLGGRYLVFFNSGSDKLTEKASKVIAKAVREARKGGFKSYFVVGHTDTQAASPFNLNLSKRRAAAVKEALIAQGVPAEKVKTSATGEKDLMVMTADGVKEATNRRVEIDVQ